MYYTVTWNPGTFGHMLILIISLEEHGLDIDTALKLEKPNSHWGDMNFDFKIKMIHDYDRQALVPSHKIIKPYFKDENLKYFQWYRNELTYLNANNHFLEELEQRWDYVEPLCDIGYNIDMTEFYTNQKNFCANMATFIGKPTLKDETIRFISKRRENNWALYQSYLDNVVDTVECLRIKKHKDLTHLSNIEIASVLCEYFWMDAMGKNKFCKHSGESKPKSTTEILTYV